MALYRLIEGVRTGRQIGRMAGLPPLAPRSVLVKSPSLPSGLASGSARGKQLAASDLAKARQAGTRLKTQAKIPASGLKGALDKEVSGPKAADAQKALTKARGAGVLSEHPVRSVLVRGTSTALAGKAPQLAKGHQSVAALRFQQGARLDATKLAARQHVLGVARKAVAPAKPAAVKGGQAAKSVLVKDRSRLRDQVGRAKQAPAAVRLGQASKSAAAVAKKVEPGALEAARVVGVLGRVL